MQKKKYFPKIPPNKTNYQIPIRNTRSTHQHYFSRDPAPICELSHTEIANIQHITNNWPEKENVRNAQNTNKSTSCIVQYQQFYKITS